MYLDTNELNLMFGEDPEIFEEILGDFVDTYEQMLSDIDEAIKIKNAENLQITAHTFKGVLGTFCALEPKEIAFFLEEAGKNGNFEGVEEKFHKLKEGVEGLMGELKNFNFNQAA